MKLCITIGIFQNLPVFLIIVKKWESRVVSYSLTLIIYRMSVTNLSLLIVVRYGKIALSLLSFNYKISSAP
jgi:hypothetical protein